MYNSKKRPIGVELLRRGMVTENDIDNVISYQTQHPEYKAAEIFYILNICSAKQLLDVLGETIDKKTIAINRNAIKVSITDYFPMEYVLKNKVLPFELNGNTIKIAFGNDDPSIIEDVERKMAQKNLIVDQYITFSSLIDETLNNKAMNNSRKINVVGDMSTTVDNIIKDAMKKRASDIHFEPLDDCVRIRMRIDGELLVYGIIEQVHKQQLIGRLKAISNMFQEKQESQDGRITIYPDYNIRVSSQKNIYGEKMVLRLLKKNANILDFGQLGYPNDSEFMNRYFKKVNGMTILTAPTGEGKTTTLYSIINQLNDPSINITTIEDPVEIRIEGLNQIEVNDNISFSDSLRTVLRQDPEIILVGEIRDYETAQIAVDSAHTGHYVLTTLHTVSAIDALTRLRKLGISDYDISGTVNTIVSQRLVRRLCSCAKERNFTENEIKIMENIEKKYNCKFDYQNAKTYIPVGCEKCEGTGYYDRIAIYEILEIDDVVRDMINNGESVLDIRKYVIQNNGFKPIQVEGINKILSGKTTFSEVIKKININA